MVLSHDERRFLASTLRAVLVTRAPDGRPRPVPICFVLADDGPVLFTPLDEKPKRSSDPLALARVRDIAGDPRVSILADRWDEDWTRLAWVRLEGRAELCLPGADEHAVVIDALRRRYAQYQAHRLEERPLIRVAIDRVRTWGTID